MDNVISILSRIFSNWSSSLRDKNIVAPEMWTNVKERKAEWLIPTKLRNN